MSEKRTEFFFSYKNGNSRQVSKEEWEREWLNWWLEKNRQTEASDTSDSPKR